MAMFHRSGDSDVLGVSVPYGFGREFSHNAENGMGGLVGEFRSGNVESHVETCGAYVMEQGGAYRAFHVALFKRSATEIPNAVAQFLPAGIKCAGSDSEVQTCFLLVGVEESICGVDLHRYAGEVLRD